MKQETNGRGLKILNFLDCLNLLKNDILEIHFDVHEQQN